MRSTARSLAELREGLMENLELLTGNAVLPPIYGIGMKLTLRKDIWSDVIEHSYVTVNVLLELDANYLPNPIMRYAGEKISYICFKHDFELSLSLDTWSLACALAVGHYFSTDLPGKLQDRRGGLLATIDEGLALHFPGWSRKRLEDMVAAEIIPVEDSGRPHTDVIMAILFASKTPALGIEPPNDFE